MKIKTYLILLLFYSNIAFASNMDGAIIFVTLPVAGICLVLSMLVADKTRKAKGVIRWVLLIQSPNYVLSIYAIKIASETNFILDIATIVLISLLSVGSSLLPIAIFKKRLGKH